jgi:hypothetical protein
MTYQERFDSRFKDLGYVLDQNSAIRAGPSTKTIEFKELLNLLRSKDEAELEKMRWVWDDEDKFLNMNSDATSSNQG